MIISNTINIHIKLQNTTRMLIIIENPKLNTQNSILFFLVNVSEL